MKHSFFFNHYSLNVNLGASEIKSRKMEYRNADSGQSFVVNRKKHLKADKKLRKRGKRLRKISVTIAQMA